jgi:hypothetical protein
MYILEILRQRIIYVGMFCVLPSGISSMFFYYISEENITAFTNVFSQKPFKRKKFVQLWPLQCFIKQNLYIYISQADSVQTYAFILL